MNKMSLEQFRSIKARMLEIINSGEQGEFTEEQEAALLAELNKLQETLLNSDLSDIPFEEWEGMFLYSEGELDLSKTHANIDFALLEDIAFESIKLDGCNLRNVGVIDYKEDTFDDEYKKAHPELFPDESVPEEVKGRFYKQELTFEDIFNYPSLKKCVNPNSFGKYSTAGSGGFVKHVGFKNAMKLLDEFPELVISYVCSAEASNVFYGLRYPKDKVLDEDASYEEARIYFFEIIFNSIRENFSIKFPDMSLIPVDIKDKFPQVFIEDVDLPPEVKDAYYNGKLTVYQVRKFYEILKNKDLGIGTSNNLTFMSLVSVFGSIDDYMQKVPRELDNPMSYYLYNLSVADDLERITGLPLEELFKEAIYNYMYGVGANNYYDLEDLYNYSKYIPLQDVIMEDVVVRFIEKVGFENLVKFNKEYDYVLETCVTYGSDFRVETSLLYAIVLNLPSDVENIQVNSYEDLEELMRVTIGEMGRGGNYADKLAEVSHKLCKLCPDVFVDGKLVEEILPELSYSEKNSVAHRIQRVVNGSYRDLVSLLDEYPQLLDLFKNFEFRFDIMNVAIIYDVIGHETFMNMLRDYKGVAKLFINIERSEVDKLLKDVHDGMTFEQALNKFLYERMEKRRDFNLREMPESFRKEHPDLFLPEGAPDNLVNCFYGFETYSTYNLLRPTVIARHPEWIPYLDNIDLEKSLDPIFVRLDNYEPGSYYSNTVKVNAYNYLAKFLSNRELLEFVCAYATAFENTDIVVRTHKKAEPNIKDELLHGIRDAILRKTVNYNETTFPDSFREKNPDLYLDANAPEDLKSHFYNRSVVPALLISKPEYIPYLLEKKLEVCVGPRYIEFVLIALKHGFNNQQILDLFLKYGHYLAGCSFYLPDGQDTLEELEEGIKNYLIAHIASINYGEDLYPLIGDRIPEAFLAPDAPEELKAAFYSDTNGYLDFKELKAHPEWVPYLIDKLVAISMSKVNGPDLDKLNKFFDARGVETGLRLGMKNPDAVLTMINRGEIELLFRWYDELHFIPNAAVMLEFPVDQIDKFKRNGKLWSNIMRIPGHNEKYETIVAMMKAAYAFGVFDGDQEGYTQFMHIYTDIPKKLTFDDLVLIIHSPLIGAFIPSEQSTMDEVDFILLMPQFDEVRELINKLYRRSEDGTYILNVDVQNAKADVQQFRYILDKSVVNGLMTPGKSHNMFGAFTYSFDPEFRDFLVKNMDEILNTPDYISLVSKMQNKWKAFKTVYSNQVLTIEMFKVFLMENQYDNVEVGNDLLAAEVGIGAYSQEDFETVQRIYNHGKERVYSSIPRVAGEHQGHYYEMLRLDDVLPACIGYQSDCCQEIGNAAQTCMEHSIVSEHGRVFVVRDSEGNIEAQSWVWRNKNVLCFDNIEVPHKAFDRATAKGITREDYTDQILEVYKKAAEELMEADRKMYQSLLEAGKITQEQYDHLVLQKITSGGGYNDVLDSLERNTQRDTGEVSRTLPFEQPVPLGYLYTHDSAEQYILAGKQDVTKSDEVTLPVYHDEFRIYDKTTITEKVLLMINRMELASKNSSYGRTFIFDRDHIMESLAGNYGLDPNTTRIIMNANFVVIYCIRNNMVVIGDIIQNTKINENTEVRDIDDIVQYQTRLALEQIKGDMEFDTSLLDDEELEMFNKAIGAEEKGFAHGN